MIGLVMVIFLGALVIVAPSSSMVLDKNRSALKVDVYLPKTLPAAAQVISRDVSLTTLTVTVQQGAKISSKVIDVNKGRNHTVIFENQLPGKCDIMVKAKDQEGFDILSGTTKVSARPNTLTHLNVPLKLAPGDLYVHFFFEKGTDLKNGLIILKAEDNKSKKKQPTLTSPLYIDQENSVGRASFSQIPTAKWKIELDLMDSWGEARHVTGGFVNISPGRITTARITTGLEKAVTALNYSAVSLPKPAKVKAVYQAGSVVLTWDIPRRHNVAGFFVYRNSDGGAKVRIGSLNSTQRVFVDREVKQDRTYQYWVQGVDIQYHTGLLSKSVTIRTSYPDLEYSTFSAINAAYPLKIPTYEKSGQAIHPDIIFVPTKWNGYHYWMAYTPYPYTHERYENPSIVVSNDGISWKVPANLHNPVIKKPTNGHLSDTNLCLGSDNRLYMYFRERHRFQGITPDYDEIFVSSSADGIHWEDPQSVARSEKGFADVLSPAVIRMGNKYYMYTVSWDAGNIIQLRTSYIPRGEWSAPLDVQLVGTPQEPGYVPWHINVVEVEGVFYAVITMKNYSVHGRRNLLFMAQSSDGRIFYLQGQPLLRNSETGWDNGGLYQSALIPAFGNKNETFRLYYSAFNRASKRVWKTGFSYVYGY